MTVSDAAATASLALSLVALAVSLGKESARPVFAVSQDISLSHGERVRRVRVWNAGVGAMFDVRVESAARVEGGFAARVESGGVWEFEVAWGEPDDGWWMPSTGSDAIDPTMPRVRLSYRTAPFMRRRRATLRPGRADRWVA